jgi:hypothetical protein
MTSVVRTGPDPNCPLITQAPLGTEINLLAYSGSPGWWKTDWAGPLGWIYGDQVTPIEDTSGVRLEQTAGCTSSSCGDGMCVSTETCATCPFDCGNCAVPSDEVVADGSDGSLCGDGVCQADESAEWCGDCAVLASAACGNGQVETGEACDGEGTCGDILTCSADCSTCLATGLLEGTGGLGGIVLPGGEEAECGNQRVEDGEQCESLADCPPESDTCLGCQCARRLGGDDIESPGLGDPVDLGDASRCGDDTCDPNENCETCPEDCGNICVLSDRALKENVENVDGRSVLDALGDVPVSTWSYIEDEPGVSHMGPMAQDFYAAFGLGGDDEHINLVDANGVVMAALQGLYERAQEKDTQIEHQQGQMAALEARLEVLEQSNTQSSRQPVLLAYGLLIGGAFVTGFALGYRRRASHNS